MTKTIELLEKEIKLLTEARDGIGKAFNVLKRDNIEDDHLRELYNEFDYKLKDYQNSIDDIKENNLRSCVSN
jgi:hypothetical protein